MITDKTKLEEFLKRLRKERESLGMFPNIKTTARNITEQGEAKQQIGMSYDGTNYSWTTIDVEQNFHHNVHLLKESYNSIFAFEPDYWEHIVSFYVNYSIPSIVDGADDLVGYWDGEKISQKPSAKIFNDLKEAESISFPDDFVDTYDAERIINKKYASVVKIPRWKNLK